MRTPIEDLNRGVRRKEAAQLLGISEETLDRMARLRKGPPRRTIGRCVTYTLRELLSWRDAQGV